MPVRGDIAPALLDRIDWQALASGNSAVLTDLRSWRFYGDSGWTLRRRPMSSPLQQRTTMLAANFGSER